MRIALISLLLLVSAVAQGQNVLEVRETNVPMLIERKDNVLLMMKIYPYDAKELKDITLEFPEGTPLKSIKSVKLYYGGTDAKPYDRSAYFSAQEYISAFEPGKTLKANPSYSRLLSRKKASRKTVLKASQPLFPGVNYFWVSLQLSRKATLADKIQLRLTAARADSPVTVKMCSEGGIVHRTSVGVRHSGDDGVHSYRIPGLVTSVKGTLLATYDIRYNSSRDLQDHIDVGVSRSTDGGRTWSKMSRAISMGEWGGLPLAQNGCGDAAILSDDTSGRLWIASIWAHGMGHQASWWSTTPGMTPQETAQLVMVYSDDDGKTWSTPRSVSHQMKNPAWAFFFNGPGRGITMADSTLVFASQYTDYDNGRTPHAGIIYSKDHGETWTVSAPAKEHCTESQVAQLPDGSLMLNMRDNHGGSRSVAVTHDMGRTWEEHPSSRSALREPVCMASLISVPAAQNSLGRDILLFSNPDSDQHRHRITIKASLDGGLTWNSGIMLDEDGSWGYSCLTMVDPSTVGILYESSVANITFQTVPLEEVVAAQ